MMRTFGNTKTKKIALPQPTTPPKRGKLRKEKKGPTRAEQKL
jgi:hypothetical protein